MSSNLVARTEFKSLILQKTPIIDVRAPIEFIEGDLPNSINLPILDDEERALVGTEYKRKGQEAAIVLGNKLVSGQNKEQKIQSWLNFLSKNPEAVFTCFRGGLRSRTAQEWALQAGCSRPRIDGGYKAFRNFLMEHIQIRVEGSPLLVVGGATGAGKSLLLRELNKIKSKIYDRPRKVLDLEKMANHRGSAFGGYGDQQPSQINFEHKIAEWFITSEVIENSNSQENIILEDESRLIGKSVQPEVLFNKLRLSPLIFIDEDLTVRTENTFQDYILNSDLGSFDLEKGLVVFERYQRSLDKIQKRLGGARHQEVKLDLQMAQNEFIKNKTLESNKIWIEKLLKYYYDPMYMDSLQKRSPNIIFKGNRAECLDFLLTFK